MSDITKGVLYIVTGQRYTEMALASAESLKRHNPNLKVHLFTDQEIESNGPIDSIGMIADAHRRSKVDYMHKSPFEHTLFLDADTFVLENLDELFNILVRFDIALSHAHKRNKTNLQKWREEIPLAFPQMNSGVILFRKNEKTLQLLKDWQVAFQSTEFTRDQITLRELLWLSDLKIHILPPEYNVRFKKYIGLWTEEEASPKILHFLEFTEFYTFLQNRKED